MEGGGAAGVRGILFTDVVDSTGLRTRLGERRADHLRRDHDALFDAAVSAHGGRILRWTGDGLKADFASASAAVAAAIDLQRAVRRYGRSTDAVAPFEVRVGVSIGEVVEDDGDVHGVAVIEGARLEAMAAPGEILATDLVERLGRRRVDATFEPAGTHTLKGLDQPVTVVRVLAAADGGARPVPRSLAVDPRFPLVGRADDLERAFRAWDGVRAGGGATVLVGGQPGIGKSRFLAQIAERAHADGALVLAGACDSDLAVPYQPFALALAELRDADDDLRAAVGSGEGPLGPLFPSRRAARFEDGGPAARYELFEAVVALVERLAHDQPVVLALEDLQWATAPTVQLLRHLVRHSSDARLLLLVNYRVDEVVSGHPLQELLSEARTAPTATRVELGPLTFDDVAALVATRVPAAPPTQLAAFAQRVCDESGGSPFFVCELLDHLSVTGQLDGLVNRSDGPALPLPDSVRDVVGQRLGRLGPGAAELLATAAVVGLTFDLDLVATLAGRTPEDVLGILEEVARVALVREVDAGRFTFAHAIVRSTLLGDLSATRLALAHRRVAEAIEGLGRPDHDQLAHHWSVAGNEDKAIASLELAAHRDLEALAYESAAERFQAVLDHHGRVAGGGDAAALARAWLGLGLSRRALGQIDFIPAIEEAGRLGRRLGDADVVAEAAIASVWPGTFFVLAGQTPMGLVELGEDALALVDHADPRRARILATLASHLTFDGDLDRCVDLLREALELARRIGDPELTGSVLVAEHLALWNPTTASRRVAIAAEVGRMARAAGDVDLEFYAGFFTAISSVERADVAAARRALEALAGPIAASRNFYFGFLADRLSTSLDVLCGVDGTKERIDDLARRYDGTHADTFGTFALQTGALALQAGTLADLLPVLQALVDSSHVGLTWRAPLGLALLESGDRAAAEALLDHLEPPPMDYFWLTATQIIGQLAAQLGRVDHAKRIHDSLLPFREQLGITASGSLCLGLVATTLGELAIAIGDHTEAIEHLARAVTVADAIGAPYEATRARRLLVAALIGDGRSGVEIEAVRAAASTLADTHGFAGEARQLETFA